MKRLISFICLISICLTLCSCDPVGHNAGDWLEPEKIESVELIHYDNDEQSTFEAWPRTKYKFRKLQFFDGSKATVLKTLNEESLPDFVESFSGMHIWTGYFLFDSPKDECIRINYSDGSYTVIYADSEQMYKGKGFVAQYAPDGEVEIYYGSVGNIEEYNNLTELFDCDTE